MPFILGATVLSEVRLATMQQDEELKEEGMHRINLCSLEGQLCGRSESSKKVSGVSENSLDFFHYLLPLQVLCLSFSVSLNGNDPEMVVLCFQHEHIV